MCWGPIIGGSVGAPTPPPPVLEYASCVLRCYVSHSCLCRVYSIVLLAGGAVGVIVLIVVIVVVCKRKGSAAAPSPPVIINNSQPMPQAGIQMGPVTGQAVPGPSMPPQLTPQASGSGPKFDPNTGQPIQPSGPKFDPTPANRSRNSTPPRARKTGEVRSASKSA